MTGHPTERVLSAVLAERMRQDEKWGEQHHPNHPAWTGVWSSLIERLERGAREELEIAPSWGPILLEEVGEALRAGDDAALRQELVQVAAVAVAWIEALDRREPRC